MIEAFLQRWWGSDGHLETTSPPGLVLLAAVLASLIVLAHARRVGGATTWRAAELFCLVVALMGLLAALTGPVWVEESGRREEGRVLVLVDASRSMGVLEGGRPRSDVARARLEEVLRLAPEAEVLSWSDELSPGAPTQFDRPETDLMAGLQALADRLAVEEPAAVVLLTDGVDRGALRRIFQEDPQRALGDLPGPVTVVQVGDRQALQDLAVESLDTAGYAFVRAPFKITAHFSATGEVPNPLSATLERDGQVVTSRAVSWDEAGKGTITFEVVPEEAGRFTYTVRVPASAQDAVPENNVLSVVVSVVRDRIRVLQVAGAPSWDVKFLRRFLKGDPSVQLVSFFILRTTSDMMAGYDEDELSLIQFPYERLFDQELWSFDAVIFQNYDYEPYFGIDAPVLLSNLVEYVEKGGAFAMIGGDRSFELGGYGQTALADILPVRLADRSAPPSTDRFVPALTPAGRDHPITRLVSDPLENAAWWARLAPLDGTHRVLGLAPGAAALLEHPELGRGASGRLPVLAVREVGQGRTMALTVDSSWRWSLSEAAAGRGNQAYLRFWKNSLRWLMKDPSTSRVLVDTARENYALGEEVRAVVRARDAGFQPLAGAEVVLTVEGPGGTSEQRASTTREGEVVFLVPAQSRGAHRLQAQVTFRGEALGAAETVFAVTSRDPELAEVVPDEAFLRWAAEALGGRYVGPDEPVRLVRSSTAGRTVWDRVERPLASHPGLLGAVAGLFGLAVLFRRWAGLR